MLSQNVDRMMISAGDTMTLKANVIMYKTVC